MKPSGVFCVCGALSLWLGCQSPALVRSARTLPEGGHDVSFSVNVSRVSIGPVEVNGQRVPLQDFNLPNPVPDVLYDYGITDDVQFGGRLSLGSGLIEAHAMLRFVEAATGTLHMALAPAAGYRVLGLVNGPVLSLPFIVTYDLNHGMSITGGPLVSYASYSVPGSIDFGDLDIRGQTVYAGGGIGLELRPALGIHLMPTVEVQRSVMRRGDIENLPVVDMLFFGLTLGWGSRRAAPAGTPAPTLEDPEAPLQTPDMTAAR
jgi:hypothetical protein